ncbi:MAG TPA: hypothetical protein VGR37_24090 [Longimicrobiaceae bacterium]|nr:hypothetical protein [Longimicrobiaceae bacterium]
MSHHPDQPNGPLFTQEEVRRALETRMTPKEVDEAMELIYTVAGGFENVAYSGELLDALATLSLDTAARLQQMRAYRVR